MDEQRDDQQPHGRYPPPPKNIHGVNSAPVYLQLFVNMLNPNPFPITFLLPDEHIFLTVNCDTTIYNWKNNTEE